MLNSIDLRSARKLMADFYLEGRPDRRMNMLKECVRGRIAIVGAATTISHFLMDDTSQLEN